MKWLALTLLLSACAQDKVAHFAAGAVTSAVVTEITGDPWQGCLAALGVGLAKEAYDNLTHAPDPMDALATVFGCSVTMRF